MHYYQFNVADYRKSTQYLSFLEHAIYRTLLDTYYLDESPLCGDTAKLMRLHGVRTEEEKAAFNVVIEDFFVLKDGLFHHEKCDDVLAKIYEKSEKARASAMKRWERNANASKTQCGRNANGMLPITQDPIPNLNDMSSKDDHTPILINQVFDLYNDTKQRLQPNWTSVDSRTKSRQSLVKKRIIDVQKRTGSKSDDDVLNWFTQFLTAIAEHQFYSGKPKFNGDSGYKWNIDSLFREKNFVAAIEALNDE